MTRSELSTTGDLLASLQEQLGDQVACLMTLLKDVYDGTAELTPGMQDPLTRCATLLNAVEG